MRFWCSWLVGLAAALGCGERSAPVEPSGKATTDCSMAEILAGTCGDTADPTLDEVPDGYVAPVDSTAVAPVDSTVVAPDPIDRNQIADPFNIQIEYRHEGGPVFTAEDIAAIERAARRWEEVIVEGFADTTTYERWVWDVIRDEYRQERRKVYIDDFYLVANAWSWDDGDGFAGWGNSNELRGGGEAGREIPLSGQIDLHMRTAEIGADWMYSLALHEIGHALGLVGIWNEGLGLPNYWLRPAFVSWFGVTDGVFFKNSETGNHFNLLGDIMYFTAWTGDVTSLSAAVLDDMGYTVNYGAVDPWRRPAGKLSVLAEHNLHLRCGVGH